MARLETITGSAISGEWGNDDETGAGIPVLRTTNFTNEGIIDFSDIATRNITKKDLSLKYLRKGDIIIEKSGGSDKQPVGRVVYFEGEENKYLFNNFTGVLRIKNPALWDSKYLFYALFANYLQGGTKKYQNRTTGLHNLQTEQFIKDFDVREYSLDEQHRIVAILDKITSLIALRKQQLAKLDELVKARFVEMFGDESLFITEPLATNVEEIFIGPFGSSLKSECFVPVEESYCMVYEQKHAIKKTMDVETRYVNKSKFNELQRFSVCGGDIIVSCRGTIGETFVVPETAPLGIMHPSIMKIRLKTNKYDVHFFEFLLKGILKQYENQANGTGIKMALTASMLGKKRLIVPEIAFQKKFSSFSESINKQVLTIRQDLDILELLKKTVVQKYFGQLKAGEA